VCGKTYRRVDRQTDRQTNRMAHSFTRAWGEREREIIIFVTIRLMVVIIIRK